MKLIENRIKQGFDNFKQILDQCIQIFGEIANPVEIYYRENSHQFKNLLNKKVQFQYLKITLKDFRKYSEPFQDTLNTWDSERLTRRIKLICKNDKTITYEKLVEVISEVLNISFKLYFLTNLRLFLIGSENPQIKIEVRFSKKLKNQELDDEIFDISEYDFVNTICRMNGKIYLTGKYVRNLVQRKKPDDKDYVVFSISERDFLRAFPTASKSGEFEYTLPIDGKDCEITFIGKGWQSEPASSIEDYLSRKDSTMNSIALELPSKRLIDPYEGAYDIHNKVLRATSEHFMEDPIRALKMARQAAQYNYKISDDTYRYMRRCKDKLVKEYGERIFKELVKALSANTPSIFFKALLKADILDVTFPEIADLYDLIDSFEHSMKVLDEVSKRSKNALVRFCSMCIELDIDDIESMDDRIVLPKAWKKAAEFVITNYKSILISSDSSLILQIILDLSKLAVSYTDIITILESDSEEVPSWLVNYPDVLEQILDVSGSDAPENLKGVRLLDWIVDQRLKLVSQYI